MWIHNSVTEKTFLSLTQRNQATPRDPNTKFSPPGASTQQSQSRYNNLCPCSLTLLPILLILAYPPPAHSVVQISNVWVIPDSPFFLTHLPKSPHLGHLLTLAQVCPAGSSPGWPWLQALSCHCCGSAGAAPGSSCFQPQPLPAQWFEKAI